MKCYLFDIDGTLADGSHREHFIRPEPKVEEAAKPKAKRVKVTDMPDAEEPKPLKEEIVAKDWDAYFDACHLDSPIEAILTLARSLQDAGEVLVFVSGRSDIVRIKTQRWLAAQGLNYDNLYMRKAGDHRNDDVIKIEMLAEIRARGFAPVMAFDDRNRVVKAWRDAGIPCAQVREGNF